MMGTPPPLSALYDQVEADYACAHDETALRRFVASNGVEHIRQQCLGCGERVADVKRATLSPGQLATLEPWDEALREQHLAVKRAAYQARIDGQREERRADQRAEYDEYLRSPAWSALRLRVLQRARWLCEGCGQQRARQVHHETYERFGREMLFDLRAVCRSCHELIHGRPLGDEWSDAPEAAS